MKGNENGVTISLCMIVKNEEEVLKRCLDSIKDLVNEIIIADTGSTDATRDIALKYTDKVYDFQWVNDFSKARNFVFSKASCDYIYSADADEYLDEENRKRFARLKKSLLPQIEIVQMYYCNQLESGSVYNFDRELRPKLFKRVRSFEWIEPVHETIRELPLVYDSDIEIIHKPQNNHSGRDIAIFEGLAHRGEKLSKKLFSMYAKELFISGTREEIIRAGDYFTAAAESGELDDTGLKDAVCVVVYACYLRGDFLKMYRYALKEIALKPASEVCYVLGEYYLSLNDPKEASVWYYNAAFETDSALGLEHGGELAIAKLAQYYRSLGDEEQALYYEELAEKKKNEEL